METILANLPGPGGALHGIITGRYDLAKMLDAILGRCGTVDEMRISTLSYNEKNLKMLCDWCDAGRVLGLRLLCSAYFARTRGRLYQHTLDELGKRGAAVTNKPVHAKVITLHTVAGDKWALEGSANLRHNDSWEQFCLVRDTAVHDFHAAWIDGLVSRHEGDAVDQP